MPGVEMICPLGDGISELTLIQINGSDEMICAAARVSYSNDKKNSDREGNRRLIKFLLKHQHGTPFEHNSITFRIKAPQFIIPQFLKHRIGTSINSESARYCELQEDFHIPSVFRAQSSKNHQGSDGEIKAQSKARSVATTSILQSYDAYKKLLEMGVSREQARSVLPTAMYTSFYMTMNLRSMFHFLSLRDDDHAQWEIRQYAKGMIPLIKDHFPISLEVWQELKKGSND